MNHASVAAASADLPLVAFHRCPVRRSLCERLRKPVIRLALVGLLPLARALPATRSPELALSADVIGLLAVTLAALGRLWCAVYIGGRKNTELCQEGPYSLVRNPLHLFSFVGVLGIALAAHRWGLVPCVGLLFLACHHLVVKAEEARLAVLFPHAYAAYCREVPRYLPRFDGFRLGTRLVLDPREVFRALLEVIWFPIAFIAVAMLTRLT